MDRALGCCDDKLILRPTFEVASAAFDSDKLGVGSSPYIGDMSGTALEVPKAPTPDQRSRYLFRLCVLSIPESRVAVVRGLRTYISLRAEDEQSEDPDAPDEIPVVSPMWSFLDGNVSWHLRRLDPNFYHANSDPSQLAGTSPQVSGSDSSLLYDPTLVPYVPPAAGIPPGDGVEYLGTWRDMRFPWTRNWAPLHVPVPGPCTLVLYASVRQTNPATRRRRLVGNDPGALGPEDRFLASFATRPEAMVRYGHVAGAMLIELNPGDQL